KRNSTHPHTYCFDWTMWDDLGLSHAAPTSIRETARDRGYQILSATQGIRSMAAALHRNLPHLIVGLDSATPHIRKYLPQHSYPLQGLSAYYTCQQPDTTGSRVSELSVRDRFDTCSRCTPVVVPGAAWTEYGGSDLTGVEPAVSGRLRRPSGRVAPRTELEE